MDQQQSLVTKPELPVEQRKVASLDDYCVKGQIRRKPRTVEQAAPSAQPAQQFETKIEVESGEMTISAQPEYTVGTADDGPVVLDAGVIPVEHAQITSGGTWAKAKLAGYVAGWAEENGITPAQLLEVLIFLER